MKLSNDTIKILKNYATISDDAVFRKGNKLRTIASSRNIYSVAEIEEEIPRDCVIYDLGTFLNMVSCVEDDYEINFKEKNLEIVSDRGVFEIFYVEEKVLNGNSLVNVPPEHAPGVENIYSFDISASEFQTMMKAISVTSAPTITFLCNGKDVIMKANDRRNESSNCYRKKIGEFNEEFKVICQVDNLKIIPEDYTVSICRAVKNSKRAALLFVAKNRKLEYFIATEEGTEI